MDKSIRLVDNLPCHPADTALGRFCNLVVGVGREVEITVGASLAPVGHLDDDSLAPDYSWRWGSAGLEREQKSLTYG